MKRELSQKAVSQYPTLVVLFFAEHPVGLFAGRGPARQLVLQRTRHQDTTSCSRVAASTERRGSNSRRSGPRSARRRHGSAGRTRERELLDVPYVHVVFTLPHALLPLGYRNRARFVSLALRDEGRDAPRRRRGPTASGGSDRRTVDPAHVGAAGPASQMRRLE